MWKSIRGSEEENTQTLFSAGDLVLSAEETCFSLHVPTFLLPTCLSVGPFSLTGATGSTQSLPRLVRAFALDKRD